MNLFVILGILIGLCVGLNLPIWLTNFVRWYERRKLMKDIYPTPVDESRLCKEPHKWIEVPTTDGSGNYSTLNVCNTCGFISGRDLMATPRGLERIAFNKKLFAFEKQLEQDFIDGENRFLDHFLRRDRPEDIMTMEKLIEVYNAGKTCNKRFVIYKLMINEQLKEVPNDTET